MNKVREWIKKDLVSEDTNFSGGPGTRAFLNKLLRDLKFYYSCSPSKFREINHNKRVYRKIRRGEALPVAGYPDDYVGKDGSIYRLGEGAMELSPTQTARGYMVVNLCNGKYKTHKVHRLVAERHIPNPDPEKLTDVHHIDGNRSNNHVGNLKWVTHAANMALIYNGAEEHDDICPYCGSPVHSNNNK